MTPASRMLPTEESVALLDLVREIADAELADLKRRLLAREGVACRGGRIADPGRVVAPDAL